MDLGMRVYEVPEGVRKAVPGCPVLYISSKRIPDEKLRRFYEKVIMPMQKIVIKLLEQDVSRN